MSHPTEGVAHNSTRCRSRLSELEGRQKLLDENGSSFMIHAGADDHTSQPIGGAGDRIACGALEAIQ